MKVDSSDGEVLVAGLKQSSQDTVIRRYRRNGLVRTGFGINGEAPVPDCAAPTELRLKDLVIQPNGRLLAHGLNEGVGFLNVNVSRQLADGSEDQNF